MLFGANTRKGSRVREHASSRSVTVGQDGYTLDDVLTHDAHERDTTLHSMLAAMKYPDYPVALGVIRAVEDDIGLRPRRGPKQVEEVESPEQDPLRGRPAPLGRYLGDLIFKIYSKQKSCRKRQLFCFDNRENRSAGNISKFQHRRRLPYPYRWIPAPRPGPK